MTVVSPRGKETTADLMVMPRCRSSARVSVRVLPSSTLPISSMTPALCSRRSVRLVLPASMCARMARFRVFTRRHILGIGGDPLLGGHVRFAHFLLLGSGDYGRCAGWCPRSRADPGRVDKWFFRPCLPAAGVGAAGKRGRDVRALSSPYCASAAEAGTRAGTPRAWRRKSS